VQKRFWKWSVVKPVVASILASIEVWLKFDRVSWPLYLICDKRSASWSDVWIGFHASWHIWVTRSFWNFEVNNKVLIHGWDSANPFYIYCEIGNRRWRFPPHLVVYRVIVGCYDTLRLIGFSWETHLVQGFLVLLRLFLVYIHLTFTSWLWVLHDVPTYVYCIQVKLVGRREKGKSPVRQARWKWRWSALGWRAVSVKSLQPSSSWRNQPCKCSLQFNYC